jgi:hypothetical protein
VDCVVVAHGTTPRHQIETAMAAVLEAIGQGTLRPPDSRGIFREAVTVEALLDPAAAGSLDESPAVYGKRLQMLTDTVPVFGEEAYRALREQVFRWYLRGHDGQRPFAFLASELVRYRRSYWAWQTAASAGRDDGAARLRLAKLDSTRLVTVAGLLFLLGEGACREDPVAWVLERLDLTPLERLLHVVRAGAPETAEVLHDLYARTHAHLASPAAREALTRSPERGASRAPAASAADLTENVAALRAAVNAALLERRGHWPDWFFESLLL